MVTSDGTMKKATPITATKSVLFNLVQCTHSHFKSDHGIKKREENSYTV